MLALAVVVVTPAPEPSWGLPAVDSDVTKILAAVKLRQTALGPIDVDFYNGNGQNISETPDWVPEPIEDGEVDCVFR
jgi:hypothetical protein